MLRILRSGQRWLTGAIVIGIGGVFVFFMGLGGPLQGSSSGAAVITVGPYSFGMRDFQMARNEREDVIRQRLGDQYDARAMRDTIDQLATQSLIERSLLAVEGRELGLAVSTEEIERSVRAGFRDAEGRFDREQFTDWAEYTYGNERNFIREQRMRMLAGKMLGVMRSNAHVSMGEARQAVRQRNEEVRIAFVAFDATEPPDDFEATSVAVDNLLDTRATEVRSLYDERRSTYESPEQVRARHILFRVNPDADEEAENEVRERAEAALARLAAGEDFAALVEELSDDEGSRETGGDMGFFPRGRMVKPFEDAAFALANGETSELVRSDFGFHIIRTEDHKEAFHRAFEEVREELAADLLRLDEARAVAYLEAEELSAVVAAGTDLEKAANDAELHLERSGLLKRRPDGFVPRLGAAQELMATAFGMEPGQSSAQIFEVGDKLALFQLLERVEPDADEIESLAADEREELLERKRNAQINSWIESRRRALEESGEFSVNIAAIQGSR